MIYFKSHSEIAKNLSERLKSRRIAHNLTQKELAERSGVSFGSVKRFEQQGEISLKHLIALAVVLGHAQDFEPLFEQPKATSIDQVLSAREQAKRKRVRK